MFYMRNDWGTSITWRAVAGTPAVWITVGIATAAQCAVTYVPVLQQALDIEAARWDD